MRVAYCFRVRACIIGNPTVALVKCLAKIDADCAVSSDADTVGQFAEHSACALYYTDMVLVVHQEKFPYDANDR